MCTNIRRIAKNEAAVVGRPQEFAAPLDSRLIAITRGYEGVSSAPSGEG